MTTALPDHFPLPPLVKITGPIGPPASPLPSQDRVNWWGWTTDTTFLPIPPAVVEEMLALTGGSVWLSRPGESDTDSMERVRLELNSAAERLGDHS